MLMGMGAGALTVVLSLTKPAPGLIMAAMMLYLVGGALLIARYAVAHEDEIPMRRRDDRRC
jgi:hypothetical protein